MLGTLNRTCATENPDSSPDWNAVEEIVCEMLAVECVVVAAMLTLTTDGAPTECDTALESVTRIAGTLLSATTRSLINDNVPLALPLSESAMSNETCPNAPDAMKGSSCIFVSWKSGVFGAHMHAQCPVLPRVGLSLCMPQRK
jgi:hypothetical protein